MSCRYLENVLSRQDNSKTILRCLEDVLCRQGNRSCDFSENGNSIGNGVLKANDPNNLLESVGGITLTDNRARGLLKSMAWGKRKGAIGNIEPSA